MPLRLWKCQKCEKELKTKREAPVHCSDSTCILVLTVPTTKFLEKTDPERGKSSLINQQTILRDRARRFSRDHELDDLIQSNEKDLAFQNGWLKRDGTKRRAIDDL